MSETATRTEVLKGIAVEALVNAAVAEQPRHATITATTFSREGYV